MSQIITKVYPTKLAKDRGNALREAAKILAAGGVVAIPTETVYGLAANALDGEAVKRIFAAKGRPSDNPLIVHISDMSMLASLISELPEAAERLMAHFWPGPLTIILPRYQVPDETTGGLDTVGIRMPDNKFTRDLIRLCGFPLAAPSANLSGRPSPTSAERCLRDLDGRVEAIVDGGVCKFGLESTVVSMVGGRARLLRPGAVTLEQLEAVIGPVEVDAAVLEELEAGATAASPGMKYKHYSPAAQVHLVKGDLDHFAAYVNALEGEQIYAMVFDGEEKRMEKPCLPYGARQDTAAQAHNIFEVLRRFDDMGARQVYVRCPSLEGMGLAVYNRLVRAAGFDVIEL